MADKIGFGHLEVNLLEIRRGVNGFAKERDVAHAVKELSPETFARVNDTLYIAAHGHPKIAHKQENTWFDSLIKQFGLTTSNESKHPDVDTTQIKHHKGPIPGHVKN